MSVALLLTLGLTIVIVAIFAGLYARNRGLKTLLMGLGLALILPGLYLLGFTGLLINGIRSLIDWAQRTVFDTEMTVGAVLLGLGVLLFLVSLALAPKKRQLDSPGRRPRTPANQRKVGAPTRNTTQPTGTSSSASRGTSSSTAKGTPATSVPTDSEDDEVEQILRRRGIM